MGRSGMSYYKSGQARDISRPSTRHCDVVSAYDNCYLPARKLRFILPQGKLLHSLRMAMVVFPLRGCLFLLLIVSVGFRNCTSLGIPFPAGREVTVTAIRSCMLVFSRGWVDGRSTLGETTLLLIRLCQCGDVGTYVRAIADLRTPLVEQYDPRAE